MTEEVGNWFEAAATGRRTRFDARDILLDVHLDCCIRLRNLCGDATDLNEWSYTWIDCEGWQNIQIGVAFVAFGWTVRNEIAWSWRTE